MKSFCTVITTFLLLTAATLFAQTDSEQLVKANIPFRFGVQDHLLPAGEYTIFTVTPERMIRIASADGKYAAIINTVPNYTKESSTNSRLVFHRYGNQYFLTQVWTAGQNVTRDPLPGKRALDLARSAAVLKTTTVMAQSTSR